MFLVTAKIMGLGFRLNLKWVFPLQSPFHSKTPSKLFSASSSVSGKEGYFNSPRLSFLSVISEESESFCKDPVKACTFSSASPQTLEDGFSQREDIKVPTSLSPDSNGAPNLTHFSLLVQSLGALEESFADSDASRLEREILLQLGRLGALAFFDTRFSRSLGTSPGFLDLSSAATECVEAGEKVVRTGKSRKRRSANPDNVSTEETMWRGVRRSDASSARRAGKSRTRRLSVSRNEADMATAVKIIVKLERIRTALEEETGGVASLSLWAEAAGLDEDVLRKRLSFGWQCRDELLRSTKALVLYLARSYRGLGIAVDDLLQAGKLGVLQGAERFDQTRGYRFSTYVRYWIKKSMSRLVASHARGVLIPATVSKAMNQIQKARKAVSNDQRRYPDEAEIATLTGLSLDKIRLATTCLRPLGSVDHKINDSFSGKPMEYMADVTVKRPEESVMRQHMKRDMSNMMSVLESRERHVLILRYGLADAPPKSLEEIGRIFHVSKEWIRKIEKKALRKLRDEEANGDLSHYLRL